MTGAKRLRSKSPGVATCLNAQKKQVGVAVLFEENISKVQFRVTTKLSQRYRNFPFALDNPGHPVSPRIEACLVLPAL
jgi:hypothetical protein